MLQLITLRNLVLRKRNNIDNNETHVTNAKNEIGFHSFFSKL